MNATLTQKSRIRRGTKEEGSAGQIPQPNQGETRDQYTARCTTAGHKDTAAIEAAWKKANPDKTPKQTDTGELTRDEVSSLISQTLETSLKAQLPEHLKSQVTPEAIRQIIAEEIGKLGGDAKTLSREEIKSITEAAAKAGYDSVRRDPKQTKDPADAGQRGQIEIPFSLRKGNLPLHMKQLANILLHRDQNAGIPESMLQKGAQLEDSFWAGLEARGTKALTTSGDGTGAEWMPRTLSSELYRRMYLDSQVAQAWLAQEVQMPTDPYDYPLLTTNPEFKLNSAENTEATPTEVGTGKFTLTTQTLMALLQFSYKADEDSIIPVLPTFQQKLAEAAARALEDAIINGDTTSTHFDTGYTVALNDVRRSWKGLRKLATAASLTVDFATGGISRGNLLALVKALGKWGVRTQDLLWIVGTNGWATLLGLDEVALAYARGQASTYSTGGPTPAPWGGMIAVSEQVGENLTSAAIYDGSTTTKGQIILCRKEAFVMGSRREFMVEVDRNIKSQTHDVVASFRKAFQPVETPSSTIKTVAVARNYTP